MSKSWRVSIVVLGLTVLHFLLHVGLGLGDVAPDLLTVALLVGVREVEVGWGAGIGLVLGLFEDAFAALAFGASTVAMTIVGIAGARTRDLFVGDSLIFLVSYLFVGKWLKDLVYWIAVGEDIRQPFLESMLIGSSLAAAYATAVGVVAITIGRSWWETDR
jgi:rod shape-determining protein MreD